MADERKSTPDKVTRSEDEWRGQLTAEQYHVVREKGTERAFTGKYHDHKGKGVYRCVGCGQPLFRSDSKFESGTGWPSFHTPYEPDHVETEPDDSLGTSRTEVVCSKCQAHLGHLFPDGPTPTGQRYCINSCALEFEDGESEAEE